MRAVGGMSPERPPEPGGAASMDELAGRLVALREWAGYPSYADIAHEVAERRRGRGVPESRCHPGKTTVYECFRPGRSRVDVPLIVDVVGALGVERSEAVDAWRAAYVQAQRPRRSRVAAVAGSDEPAADAAERSVSGVVQVHSPPPAPQAGFVGRRRERTLLRALGASPGGPTVAVIDGMAGIGKTQFALRVAADLDRQREFTCRLLIGLRGFDPHQPPVSPAAAVSAVLRETGVPGEQIDVLDEAALVALCREHLSGRALLVLDDAASGGQLQPILTATRGCTVLVTSRRRLPAVPEALRVTLAGLGDGDARRLIASFAGRGAAGRRRVASERDAAQRLVALCGGRPLDLSVAGAHIIAEPSWSLADQAAWLSAVPRDQAARPALTACYLALPEQSRRMLRLLALHPGGEITVHAAAALCDTDARAAWCGLRQLAGEHLLLSRPGARFAFHDVILSFARRLAHDKDPESERHAALRRVLDHYCATAAAAMNVLEPYDRAFRPCVSSPGLPAPAMPGPDQARAWLDSERGNLLAVADAAAAAGMADRAAVLAETLGSHLARTSRWNDAALLHQTALGTSDPARQARALSGLGEIDYRTGRFTEATGRLREALAITQRLGDRRGSASVLIKLGAAHQQLGHIDQALTMQEQALDLAEQLDDLEMQAKSHGNIAVALDNLARFGEALAHHRKARDLFTTVGDRLNAARADGNMGMLHDCLGQHQQAKSAYLRALPVAREMGDRDTEASVLSGLAVVRSSLRETAQAMRDARRAVRLSTEVGNRAGVAHSRGDLAVALVGAGRPQEALEETTAALQLADEIGNDTLHATLLNTRAAALRAIGLSLDAAETYHRALHLATRAGSHVEAAHAEFGLARTAADAGDPVTGTDHARRAHDIFARIDLLDAETVRQEFPSVAPERARTSQP